MPGFMLPPQMGSALPSKVTWNSEVEATTCGLVDVQELCHHQSHADLCSLAFTWSKDVLQVQTAAEVHVWVCGPATNGICVDGDYPGFLIKPWEPLSDGMRGPY